MAAVMVTGAAGFVGSHVVDALLARGETVLGVDNFDPYYSPAVKRQNVATALAQPAYTLQEVDVCDYPTLRRVAEAAGVDRIVHLAALAGVRASVQRPDDYLQVNTIGAHNILKLSQALATRQVVLASTSSVYGENAHLPFDEADPADRPLAPYPASKRAAELLAYTYHHLYQRSYAVVRFFSVYGPRGRPDMMPYMLAESIAAGREVKLFAGGELYRDWTYISDIVAGVMGALDTPLGYQIYNLGRGEPVRMADFVEILEALAGKCANVVHVPAPATEPTRTWASIARAQADFGYAPQVDVRSGLARFWHWFSEERAG